MDMKNQAPGGQSSHFVEAPTFENNGQARIANPRFDWQFLSPRHIGSWLVVVLLWLVTLMPRTAVNFLAGRIRDIALSINDKRRNIALKNLELCFPYLSTQERERWVRNHFRMAAQSLLDYGLLWWGSKRRLRRMIRVRGMEHIDKALARNKGIIIFAPHALGLDYGALAMSMRFPGISIFNRKKNALADWLNFRGRTRFGATLYQRDHGLRPIIRQIKAGRFFYYLPDEDLGTGNSEFVPLFGVPKATLPTMGRLARLSQALVIPAFSYYVPEEGCYEVTLLPAIEGYPSGDPNADALKMNQVMEQLVRLRPEQYMWTMKMFRTRPPGEAAVYS